MIKTHRPRGHFWTCPSIFQQSKEMRNIKLVDCTPPAAEAFASDLDEELISSERTAKRRRIEKLADDFLNGVPLKITSARPGPSSLKATVEWNERNRTGSKWSLPVLPKEVDDAVTWIDVQDAWTVLPKSIVKSKAKRKATSSLLSPQPRKLNARVAISTEVQEATSDCKPARHLKVLRISSEPSTEAMKQAAALRARRVQRAATEVPLQRETDVQPPTPDRGDAGPHSEPASVARPRFFRTRKPASTEWLLRRQTMLHELSPDESFDELSRSRVETPSRTQRTSSLQQTYSPALPASSGNATVCDTDSRYHARGEKEKADAAQTIVSSADPLSLSFSQKLAAAVQAETSGSAANGSYHTAPEETDVGPTDVAIALPTDSRLDSQTLQLRQQGTRAVQRTSWASTNDPRHPPLVDSPANKPAEDIDVAEKTPFIRQCVLESALHAGRSTRGKRVQSAGYTTVQTASSTSRRRSAPLESQGADANLPVEQQPAYTEVQPAQQGDTPFRFRKKRSTKADGGAHSANITTIEHEKTGRRRVTFPSSDGAQTVSKARNERATRQVATKAPVLDVSLDCDSSFGMRLNMALVDEHLNVVLPEDPGSIQRSTIKRKLRQQLIDAGAEISRVDGEPPTSQVESLGDQTVSSSDNVEDSLHVLNVNGQSSLENDIVILWREDETAGEERQSAQTQWPGTQVAIERARYDLVVSPKKPTSITEVVAQATPEPNRASTAPLTEKTVQRPLRELQQEQMPSTQAMMETWSPWSIAKKPNAVIDRPTAHTPTVRGKSTRRRVSARLSSIASDPVTTMDDISRRRSSLRFSTTNSDTPDVSTRLQYTITKPSSLGGNASTSPIDVASTPKSILKKTATPGQLSQNRIWDPSTTISFEGARSDPTEFSAGPLSWDYQAGQRRVEHEAEEAQALSDDLDIERTVTELVADVLCMNDMNDVLSQRS